MKKLFYFLCMICMCVLIGPMLSIKAKADNVVANETDDITSSVELDNSNSVVEDVENNDWILTPVVAGSAGIIGTIIIVAGFTGKLKQLVVAFNAIVSWFTKKREDMTEEEVDLKVYKENLEQAVLDNQTLRTEMRETAKQNREEYLLLVGKVDGVVDQITKQNNEINKKHDEDLSKIKDEYVVIKQVLMKLAAANPDLIRMGVADEIVKQLETSENNSIGA